MDTDKLAGAITAFGEALFNIAGQLKGQGEAPADAEYAQAAVGKEVDPDAPASDDIVEVTAGDLWRLVNRGRKMIRFAREGKVPSQAQRAPFCQSIKAVKGLVKKPHDLD